MARWPARTIRCVAFAWLTLGGLTAWAQSPSVTVAAEPLALEGPSSAYPDGTFGQHLATASQGGGGPVGGSKHRPGSGRRDDWKVGPHWRLTVDGVLLFRDSADLDAILAEVDPIAPQIALPPLEFRDNFDHAAGARLLLTSEFPQCSGYELQIGYVGVEQWMANAYWEQETLAGGTVVVDDGGTPADPTDDIVATTVDVEQRRTIGYESSLHAAEINFQRTTSGYLKPFAGVRYLGLDESVSDQNHQFVNAVLADPVNVGDTISSSTTNSLRGAEVQNDLIGFQGGLRLDMWRQTRRLHLNGFLSAGVFCNIVDRDRVEESSTVVTTRERVQDPTTMVESVNTTVTTAGARSVVSADGTRIAFATEAALAATWRVNDAIALRGGYQMLYLHGVELAENLWTAPPPVTPVEDDLFLHGWFAGFEYRR